jgi:G3E family GTPase
MSRVPVIALSGHLGAGKTSMLNHLLRHPGARLGVIVNDFGELNVDAGLVSGQVDDVAGISGGCVCCLEDSGGLDEALEKLAHERLRLDAILIEASGAADPIALARLIRYSGVDRVRPGGIIEVIDAVEHFRTVDCMPEPPARFAVATLVVINKVDLLPADEKDAVLARIMERVRARNPHVEVITVRHGAVDPTLVFDGSGGEEAADELPIAELLRGDRGAGDTDHEHSHDHARAVSVALARPVAPGSLIDLLERPPTGAYRLKGRVRVHGTRSERGFVVNLVGPMIHVAPLPVPPIAGELVAIGMHLDVAVAQSRLNAVAAAPAERPDAAGLRRLHRYRRLSD